MKKSIVIDFFIANLSMFLIITKFLNTMFCYRDVGMFYSFEKDYT